MANLLQLGVAQASAPPAGPTITKVVQPISVPGVLTTGTLQGSASATYLPQSCPAGQNLAIAAGDATGVGLIGSPPLLSLSGTNANAAESQSRSDLVANGDGTFGLRSAVSEEIAPVSINLGTGFAIGITMAGAAPGGPISLSTGTDGHGHNNHAPDR